MVTIFFPFVSPFPISSDLQPVNVALSVGYLVVSIVSRPRLDLHSVIFLFCISTFIFFINTSYGLDKVNISKAASLFVAAIVIMAIRRGLSIGPIFFSLAIGVYFVAGVFYLTIPSIYLPIQDNLINARNDLSVGVRGLSVLSPEPSFFAALLFAFLFINEWLYSTGKYSNVFLFWWNFGVLLFLLAFNKSGSAVIYFLFYIAVSKVFMLAKLFFVPVLASVGYYFVKILEFDSRAFQLVVMVINGDFYLAGDASFSDRMSDFTSMFYSLIQAPFGVGVLGVADQLTHIGYFHDLAKFKFNEVNGVTSSVSFGVISFGCFFVFYLIYLFCVSSASWRYKLASLMLLMFSVSYAFPLTWVLLYACSCEE